MEIHQWRDSVIYEKSPETQADCTHLQWKRCSAIVPVPVGDRKREESRQERGTESRRAAAQPAAAPVRQQGPCGADREQSDWPHRHGTRG